MSTMSSDDKDDDNEETDNNVEEADDQFQETDDVDTNLFLLLILVIEYTLKKLVFNLFETIGHAFQILLMSWSY